MSYEYLRPGQELFSLVVPSEEITTTYKGKDRRHIFENVQYTNKEHNLILQFRKLLKPIIQNYQYADAPLLRYLYSADFVLDDALQKFKTYHEWMTNESIQTINGQSEKILKDGAIYTYGRDKKHRPIVIMNLSIIDFNEYKIEDYYSAINAVLNLVIKHMFLNGIIEKYLFIIDMGGKNFTSLPFDGIVNIVRKLGIVYSLRLGEMLVINTNTFIKFSYMAIKPFISQQTRNRITLLSTSQMASIAEIVSQDQLESKYGGTNHDLHCHWPPRVPHSQTSTLNKNYEYNQNSQYYSIISYNELFTIEQTELEGVSCCAIENSSCLIY